ncbi:MAG: serine carboxypeptidase [Ruminococcus sp.]|nr:serine carboxypeptidase [Ruminococcus sp.]
MRKTVFLCVGGDKRQGYMCRELGWSGTVRTIGVPMTDACEATPGERIGADVLILPIMRDSDLSVQTSVGKVSFDELINMLSDGALVLGGTLRPEHYSFFSARGFTATDYFDREDLVLKNCIPTAEGTLLCAIENTDFDIFGSTVLITGFGRTARACARLFKAAGALCTVCARRNEVLTAAECEGYGTCPMRELPEKLKDHMIIINTVPAMIFDAKVLGYARKSSLFIDISSKPGGIDFTAAERLGLMTVHALGLPGKVSPGSAGRYIAETVIDILRERGETDVRKNIV